MFEDQHILTADIEQNRELIETFDSPGQSRTLEKVNDYASLFPTGGIQKRILYILGSRFFHSG
jgi:hypothetical protein